MRILILGATSWIGNCLIRELMDLDIVPMGTSRFESDCPYHDPIIVYPCSSPRDYSLLIESLQPDVVINVLRGESERDFTINTAIMNSCVLLDAFYCYASSALALDGYDYTTELTERLAAKSLSEYGIFKGRCEAEIIRQQSLRSLILRFSSIQGWPPHKPGRNEVFCRKLLAGDEVTVHRGVLQNRLYDETFVKMIVSLIMDRREGIYHLGATDASEEFVFLRKLSERLNLNTDLVVPGEVRRLNANLAIGKFLDEYPTLSYNQDDTIDRVVENAPLWLR